MSTVIPGGYWVVGDDVTRSIGWIKSSTSEHVIPTDHTSWLFSPDIGDPTQTDQTLKLEEVFDQDVEDLVTKIDNKPTSNFGQDLIEKFNHLTRKQKEQVLLQIDVTNAETLAEFIQDDEEWILKTVFIA